MRLYSCLHRIRATSRREASTVLYASRQRHQVMYCIDCCRTSAAPLAPGSSNKSDLFLSHEVLYRSNILHLPCSADHEQDWQPYPVDPYSAICDDHTYIHTYIRYYNRFMYITTSLPRMICLSKYLLCDTVWHARQIWEEHYHVTAVLLFKCSRRIVA